MKNRRQASRSKRRLVCDLVAEEGRAAGIVLDVSASGLFVQTSATPSPGSRVDVELTLPGGEQPLCIHGRVARRRAVPARLRSVVQGGVGIAIDVAPEAFFRFVAELQSEKPEPSAAAKQPTASERPQSNLARKALMERLRRLRADQG